MGQEEENVQVVVRIRPLSVTEKKAGDLAAVSATNGERQVQVKVGPVDAQVFSCQRCFSPLSSQPEFFVECGITSLLDSAVTGFRACAFAFGQTGAGKTFTMFGNGKHGMRRDKEVGLMTRSLEYLFHRATTSAAAVGGTVEVKLSCLEIYHEHVYDLFAEERERTPLNVREHATEGFYLEGARLVECETVETATAAIELAVKNRQVAGHEMNMRSSRSHCLTEIYITTYSAQGGDTNSDVNVHEMDSRSDQADQMDYSDPTDIPIVKANHTRNMSFTAKSHTIRKGSHPLAPTRGVLRGKMTLVDLAGSERLKETNSSGKVLQEAGFINRSLYVLGKVIAGLARNGDRNHKDVPFRDSKLTKLLINTLGGSCRTLLIACVSEAKGSQAETLRTLKFSMSCARIRNKPVRFLDPQERLIQDLKEEVKRLRTENKKLRSNIITGDVTEGSQHISDEREDHVNSVTSTVKVPIQSNTVYVSSPTRRRDQPGMKKARSQKLAAVNARRRMKESKSDILSRYPLLNDMLSDEDLAELNGPVNGRFRPQLKSALREAVAESRSQDPLPVEDSSILVDGKEFLKRRAVNKPRNTVRKGNQNTNRNTKAPQNSKSPYLSHLRSAGGVETTCSNPNISTVASRQTTNTKATSSRKVPIMAESGDEINDSLALLDSLDAPSESVPSTKKNGIESSSSRAPGAGMSLPRITSKGKKKESEKEISQFKSQETANLPAISQSTNAPNISINSSINLVYSPQKDGRVERMTETLEALEASLQRKREEMEDNPGEVTGEIEDRFRTLQAQAREVRQELTAITGETLTSPACAPRNSKEVVGVEVITGRTDESAEDNYDYEFEDENAAIAEDIQETPLQSNRVSSTSNLLRDSLQRVAARSASGSGSRASSAKSSGDNQRVWFLKSTSPSPTVDRINQTSNNFFSPKAINNHHESTTNGVASQPKHMATRYPVPKDRQSTSNSVGSSLPGDEADSSDFNERDEELERLSRALRDNTFSLSTTAVESPVVEESKPSIESSPVKVEPHPANADIKATVDSARDNYSDEEFDDAYEDEFEADD